MKQLRDLVPKNKAIVPKARLLTFKEYCQYVYEPSKRIDSLNLSENEKQELERIIEARKIIPET